MHRRVVNGLPITSRAVRDQDDLLYSAAVYHFSSWNSALRAAGHTPPPYPTHLWTKEEMLKALKDTQRAEGDTRPNTLETRYRRNGSGICESIRYAFGSLPATRVIAGVPVKQGWTREKVIAGLRAEARNGSVQYGSIRAKNPSLVKATTYHFGSWRAAVAAAELQPRWRADHPHPSIRWTKETVLKLLRQAGRTSHVTINSLRKKYAGIYKAALREYGSWWKALSAAGISR